MNKISCVSPEELSHIKYSNSFVVEIDGKAIQSENDWLYTMAEKFRFPVDNGQKNVNWFRGAFEYPRRYFMNWNRFQDWITDLEWLNTNSVILIIFNYKHFMTECPEAKNYIINDLKNTIDFWENEAEKCIVGGQRKDFNIFITEEDLYGKIKTYRKN